MRATVAWFFVIGSLLANGMPHFIWGRSSVIARSPIGRRSAPATNVSWGLANFVAATALSLWRLRSATPARPAIIALLTGFWLTVGMFGASIRRFLNG